MKKIILLFAILLTTLLPAGAVKKIEVNPINFAVVLAEKADSANIKSYFDYYGYELSGTDSDYTIMKHPNGNEIRYTFKDGSEVLQHPIIVVKSHATQKDTDARLQELKFEKAGNSYERTVSRYNNFFTRCTVGLHNTLIIQSIQTKRR